VLPDPQVRGDAPVMVRPAILVREGEKHRRCLHHPRESDPSMLPGATVPCPLADLLTVFRPCFTAATFRTFIGLIVGDGVLEADQHLGSGL
jgi:hypothetical protein